jgi:hypothetical protein
VPPPPPGEQTVHFLTVMEVKRIDCSPSGPAPAQPLLRTYQCLPSSVRRSSVLPTSGVSGNPGPPPTKPQNQSERNKMCTVVPNTSASPVHHKAIKLFPGVAVPTGNSSLLACPASRQAAWMPDTGQTELLCPGSLDNCKVETMETAHLYVLLSWRHSSWVPPALPDCPGLPTGAAGPVVLS